MINEALRVASAIDEINFLEEGLNTQLFPEGIKLPRTLTKKLILARSVVANPRLLLLELETNFLLKTEEKKFYDYVFSKDWTVVASTRDEGFLSRADRILYMEKGTALFTGDYKAFKLTDYAELIR
jgi:ABC-type multidrug transport system fused ATPase/permease subunit